MTDRCEVAVVTGIRGKATEVETYAAHSVVRDILANFGRLELYEWVLNDRPTKPYFDVDSNTARTTHDQLLAASLAAIDTFFGHRPDLLIIAHSHGDGTGPNAHKLSLRFFVPGFRMTPADIKARIVALDLHEAAGGPFDTAVYGRRQKLRTLGSIKGGPDRRVLRLIDRDLPSLTQILDTLVQVVDDAWPLLTADNCGDIRAAPRPHIPRNELPTVTGAAGAPAPGRPRKRQATLQLPAAQGADPAPPTAREATTPAEQPPPKRKGRPRKEDTLPQEWRTVLEGLGFNAVHSKACFADAQRGTGYSFTADNRRECPCCTRAHDSNNWYIVRTNDAHYIVKSHSEHCRNRVVRPGQSPEEQIAADCLTLADKVNGMGLEQPLDLDDAPPGELHFHRFACTRRECLACADDHGTAQCDYALSEIVKDAAWKLSNTAPTCRGTLFHSTALLPSFLSAIVAEPSCTSLTQIYLAANRDILWTESTLQDIRIWDGRSWQRVTTKEFGNLAGDFLVFLLGQTRQMDAFSEKAKQLKEAFNMCKAPAQQQALAQKILSTHSMACRGVTFDADPWLLGGEACVVELRTGVVRPAQRGDHISKSVGYAIDQCLPEEQWSAVQKFMAEIYPVEEERRLIQQFAGYCLTGSHPSRYFLCLTDRRAGSNGKSTFVKLLKSALGPYAMEGKKELLYEQRFTGSVNDHNSGMAAYEGCRLVAFEELSQKHTLDTALIKELNGGDARVPIRMAHSAETRQMDWSAKMILIFNEGGLPKIRVDDEAFLKRMLVVQHRSLFCDTQAEVDAARAAGEPFTFLKQEDAHMAVTPQAMLTWALQGLGIYHEERFTAVPETCQSFKRALVDEQDEVAAWVQERVSPRDDTWLTVKDAFESFEASGGRLTKNRFNARLRRLISGYTTKKIDGKATSAFEGFTLA